MLILELYIIFYTFLMIFFTSIYCRVMPEHIHMLIDPLKDILNEQNCYINAKTILLHVTDGLR